MTQVIEGCVGKNEDGHLDLFFLLENGELRQTWQNVGNPNFARSINFGQNIKKIIDVKRNDSGCLEIFCIDKNGKLISSRQTTPNGGQKWTPFEEIS